MAEKSKCLCRGQQLPVLCHVEQERIKSVEKSERHEGEEVLVLRHSVASPSPFFADRQSPKFLQR